MARPGPSGGARAFLALLFILGGAVWGGWMLLHGRHPSGDLVARDARPTTTFEVLAAMHNLASAQALFQASGRADTDGDGVGEYGGFHEMAERAEGRMASKLLVPHLPPFAFTQGSGDVRLDGYYYRVFLPARDGGFVPEPAGGFRPRHVDPDLGERTFCIVAWPVERGVTGEDSFAVTERGDVLHTETPFSGARDGPEVADVPGGERRVAWRVLLD